MANESARRGSKFEAIGVILILVGLAGCFSAAVVNLGNGGLVTGALLSIAGFVVFLIGRFM